MESPLDILSRAAGMVSGQESEESSDIVNLSASGTSVANHARADVPIPMTTTAAGGFLKKALLVNRLNNNTRNNSSSSPGSPIYNNSNKGPPTEYSSPRVTPTHSPNHIAVPDGEQVTVLNLSTDQPADDQPLDFSCKAPKKSPSSPPLNHSHKDGNSYGGSTNKRKVEQHHVSHAYATFLEGHASRSIVSGSHALSKRYRPSVITFASQTGHSSTNTGDSSSASPPPSPVSTTDSAPSSPTARKKHVVVLQQHPGKRKVMRKKRSTKANHRNNMSTRIVTTTTDDIDEHFRRSLGNDYDQLMVSEKKPSEADIVKALKVEWQEEVDKKHRDTSGVSVDDHFAKALGTETWTKIINNSIKKRDDDDDDDSES